MLNKDLILINALLILSTHASAFFWGSSDYSTPAPRYFYHKRVLQGPQYSVAEPENRPVPSLPMQVPMQAQFSPYPHVQNVQLVPCLCPISQENAYDQQQPTYENLYFNPNVQAPLPQHMPQQNVPPHQPQKP